MMQIFPVQNFKKGFTFIELMVVILIIGFFFLFPFL
ncbi:prepilin-type N-terminal cleavage/methylation domain-containing protein [bacterium]|nr:prepilin-type N-terminal cleavage/methylation domain-containing protein [bacterium]